MVETKKKKVLLVDDSIFSAQQLKKIIEDTGIADVVGHAKDGIEGVKMFREFKPDVVFLDILMPNMDGIQALRTIMAINRDAKAVMISSLGGSVEKAEESLRLGAAAIISKPYEPEKIKEILEKL